MTYATTFSGIGGWEIGLNACGWELKWQCEREPWCQQLLKQRFGVPIYGDITTICDEQPESVDALIGSPPCQPFSIAGAQGGLTDERHLYPAFIALVRKLKPRWVLMEQVPNIFSIPGAFEAYIGGLAALGFDCVWHRIPACAVGANHQRDRVWIMAHAASEHSGVRVQHRRNAEAGGRNYNKKVRCENPSKPAFVAADAPLLQAWNSQLPEPYLVTMDDGIPDCCDWVRGYGNAVVPQIPYLIGQAINQIEAG